MSKSQINSVMHKLTSVSVARRAQYWMCTDHPWITATSIRAAAIGCPVCRAEAAEAKLEAARDAIWQIKEELDDRIHPSCAAQVFGAVDTIQEIIKEQNSGILQD